MNINEFNEKFKNILEKRENDEYDFILKNSSKKLEGINRFTNKQIYNIPEAINTYYDNYYSLLNDGLDCNTFINGNLTGYDYNDAFNNISNVYINQKNHISNVK